MSTAIKVDEASHAAKPSSSSSSPSPPRGVSATTTNPAMARSGEAPRVTTSEAAKTAGKNATDIGSPPLVPPSSASTTLVEKPEPAPVAKASTAPSSQPRSSPAAPLAITSAVSTVPNKSKSKKKKNQPTVTMATAASAQSGGTGAQGENTGRWTAEEHRLFLQGLEQHGKGWKKIASLIKSRTVVQIRTHAQKYFQKLAKARQNGEEGDVSMEGRGGPASVASAGLASTAQANKRRRQATGTKRKAITSVVQSAQREGKKLAAASAPTGVPCPPLPAVAPALAPFVVPTAPQPGSSTTSTIIPSGATSHGAISGPALEDSLFRFLTPAPVASIAETVQVNEVARQAGANPITLPSDNPSTAPSAAGGEVSPTGVTDVAIFPSWTDAKDLPSWYAKGADVDCLLDVADTLDWLADTGDIHETYEPPPPPPAQPVVAAASNPAPPSISVPAESEEAVDLVKPPSIPSMTGDALTSDAHVDTVVPPLPSLFENPAEPPPKKQKIATSHDVNGVNDGVIDEHLNVFDTPMEEHAFVSALLENNGESSASLPVLS